MSIIYEKGNLNENGLKIIQEQNYVFFKGSFYITQEEDIYNIFNEIDNIDKSKDIYLDITELKVLNSSALKYFCELIVEYGTKKYNSKLYIQSFNNNSLRYMELKNFKDVKEKAKADNVEFITNNN
jgi:hypothetical protein